MNANAFGIAIGELLGAGIFITTIVIGAVAIVAETQLEKIVFLRDVAFYFGGIVLVVVFIADGAIRLYEAVILLSYYFGFDNNWKFILLIIFAELKFLTDMCFLQSSSGIETDVASRKRKAPSFNTISVAMKRTLKL